MNEKTTIIIADDHPLLRQGLRQVIERENDLEILTECGDGLTALREILVHQPDVVVMDIYMPHKTGLQVLKTLKEGLFAGKVILLTAHTE
jgi:two-component system, NarL family, response regulator DegU